MKIDQTTKNRLAKKGINVEKLENDLKQKEEGKRICKSCTEDKCTCYETGPTDREEL